ENFRPSDRVAILLRNRAHTVQRIVMAARITEPSFAEWLHEGRFGDRKSTRLNSSHLVISYAVFCLKKKKHKINTSYTINTTPYARNSQTLASTETVPTLKSTHLHSEHRENNSYSTPHHRII